MENDTKTILTESDSGSEIKNNIIAEYNALVKAYSDITINYKSNRTLHDNNLREVIEEIIRDWNSFNQHFTSQTIYNIADHKEVAKNIRRALIDSIQAALNPTQDALSSSTFFMSTLGFKSMTEQISALCNKYSSDLRFQELLRNIEANVKKFASTIFNKHTKRSIGQRDIIVLGDIINNEIQVPEGVPEPKLDSLVDDINKYLDALLTASGQRGSNDYGMLSYRGMPFSVTFSTAPFDSVIDLFKQLAGGGDLSNFRSTPVYIEFQKSFDDIRPVSKERAHYFDQWKAREEQKVKFAIDSIVYKLSSLSPSERSSVTDLIQQKILIPYGGKEGKVMCDHTWNPNILTNIKTLIDALSGDRPAFDPQVAYDTLADLINRVLRGAALTNDSTQRLANNIRLSLSTQEKAIIQTFKSLQQHGPVAI